MKICEHENVRCPYCGSKKDPLAVSNNSVNTEAGQRTVHRVQCSECGGTFWVTCED